MGSVVTVSTGGADWHYSATAERVAAVECVYRNHRSLPYISPECNLAAWLEEVGLSSSKLVPKWVLEVLDEVELSGGRYYSAVARGFRYVHHAELVPEIF